jgi:prevent-host-death family protein
MEERTVLDTAQLAPSRQRGTQMKVDTRDLISVTDANNKGISGLVADAERGQSRIIVRNSKPVAAVVSVGEYDRLAELEENLVLMVAAFARMATDTGDWIELDDLAAELGVDLDEPDEDEDEDED